MSRIRDVFSKMSAVGASNAVFTLHTTSEMPPANFTLTPIDAARATFLTLVAEARTLNITVHLRRCSRNAKILTGSLKAQAAFVALVPGMKIAPSLAMGDDTTEVQALLESNAATFLLVSGAWQTMRGPKGGAPVASMDARQLAAMNTLVKEA